MNWPEPLHFLQGSWPIRPDPLQRLQSTVRAGRVIAVAPWQWLHGTLLGKSVKVPSPWHGPLHVVYVPGWVTFPDPLHRQHMVLAGGWHPGMFGNRTRLGPTSIPSA